MRAIKIIILFLFLPYFLPAQDLTSEQQVFEGIAKAVKEGQSTDLSAYFASSIECDILGKEDVYSKPQAIQVMKDFFSNYKAKNFSILHKSGKGQAKFIIGNYATVAGENYRITFFVKQDGTSYFVQQIRIEDGDSEQG